MKWLKQYGIFIFWFVILVDLLLLNYGFLAFRVFTSIALTPLLMIIFWASTQRSKHYTKKFLVYVSLLCFGIAHFFWHKCIVVSIFNFASIFYIFQLLGVAILLYLFANMQPLSFKSFGWALLGISFSTLASIVSYKIIEFAYKEEIPILIVVIMSLFVLLHAFAFNIYSNKKLQKLALNGFMPGSVLLLLSFLLLLGYWYVLYGPDTQIMLIASILSNVFGLSIIIQNLIKYLKV